MASRLVRLLHRVSGLFTRNSGPSTTGLNFAPGQRKHLNAKYGKAVVDSRINRLQTLKGAYKTAGSPPVGLFANGYVAEDYEDDINDEDLSDEDRDALTYYHDD